MKVKKLQIFMFDYQLKEELLLVQVAIIFAMNLMNINRLKLIKTEITIIKKQLRKKQKNILIKKKKLKTRIFQF